MSITLLWCKICQVHTSSKVLRNRPSIASSVMITVPPSTPIPPHVPIRMKIGSLHLAWYINLIISCNNIPTEGTPMPWLTHNTGPTCLFDWWPMISYFGCAKYVYVLNYNCCEIVSIWSSNNNKPCTLNTDRKMH